MKTQYTPEQSAEALRLVVEKLRDEFKPFDSEESFREMIRECYSFKLVGGPFEWMDPARVLEEVDPVAFRCGVNDYVDGLSVSEVDGEDWNEDDIESARESVLVDLESEKDGTLLPLIEAVRKLQF